MAWHLRPALLKAGFGILPGMENSSSALILALPEIGYKEAQHSIEVTLKTFSC